jgi:O-antigen/teichoic acid export membrane protein
LFFMLMFFVISCCSFISKEIILVFGGEKYLSGTNVVPLLLMTVYCVMIYDFVSNIQFYFKKTIYASIFTVVAAGINIGLDYWLIPNYSMIGAAIGTVISYLILALLHCILSSYYSKKKLGIKDFFYTKRLALISLCGIIVNGVAYLIYDYDLVRWICFGLFFVSFFIFAFWKRYDIKELVTKKKDNNA